MVSLGLMARAGVALAATVAASGGWAQSGDVVRIIDEGLNRSQIMLTASELMDGIGPRPTRSPTRIPTSCRRVVPGWTLNRNH
ncbi:MAG: hypothetical protein ABIS39_04850 [Sphingomicrobium sp.]